MDREKIEKILDEKVRPALAADGGDISIVDYDEGEGRLVVKFLGACSGCPAQQQTVEGIVEKELNDAVPGLKEVIVDTSVDQDIIDFAKKLLRHEI